jgi:hypothetical protein
MCHYGISAFWSAKDKLESIEILERNLKEKGISVSGNLAFLERN